MTTHLDLKDGLVKEHHEVPDDAQHLAGVCGIIRLPKVLRYLLHLCTHLLLKLLHTLLVSLVLKICCLLLQTLQSAIRQVGLSHVMLKSC